MNALAAAAGAALLALALMPAPANAQQWVPGNGRSCVNACADIGSSPVDSGTYSYSGTPFLICRSNADNAGTRPGWNLPPSFATMCAVASSGREQHLSRYDCLCVAVSGDPQQPTADRPSWCRSQRNLNNAERTVCSTERLWPLDEQLNVIYRSALNSVGDQRERLRRSQEDWVRVTRNGCQSDDSCLEDVYSRRIDALRRIDNRGYMNPGE